MYFIHTSRSPPSDGVDNPAFDSEEAAPPPASTPTTKNGRPTIVHPHMERNQDASFLNSTQSTMMTSSPSNDSRTNGEVTEAVNLELVNMKPYGTNGVNGIPAKKSDSALDMDLNES
ncbi:hypothetical protein LSTR_LSTR014917 [Laodelphax striatellus]|uniref:Uncharacterized protein n=1 Tax=Laodelphax striatellus TaxID=195883 RepID=A0A482X372_LAOST|nr:hypothetical protein LSTR_LSTR014917 [Laodelphax striatellus]